MLRKSSKIINVGDNKIDKKLLNDLETFYRSINEDCDKYDYNCRQCPYDELCDKVADLIITINNNYQEAEKE